MHADLSLLLGGEHIHHAVHGLCSRTGVQGAEHQVAGFRCADRQLNRFQIPHFPHQDHVRVLAQRRTEGVGEAARVFIQLSLVHQAAVAFVYELDRILDGEDVLGAAVIDVIEQCRQGGGLARARGACDQHQAPWSFAGLHHHRGQIEPIDAGNAAA